METFFVSKLFNRTLLNLNESYCLFNDLISSHDIYKTHLHLVKNQIDEIINMADSGYKQYIIEEKKNSESFLRFINDLKELTGTIYRTFFEFLLIENEELERFYFSMISYFDEIDSFFFYHFSKLSVNNHYFSFYKNNQDKLLIEQIFEFKRSKKINKNLSFSKFNIYPDFNYNFQLISKFIKYCIQESNELSEYQFQLKAGLASFKMKNMKVYIQSEDIDNFFEQRNKELNIFIEEIKENRSIKERIIDFSYSNLKHFGMKCPKNEFQKLFEMEKERKRIILRFDSNNMYSAFILMTLYENKLVFKPFEILVTDSKHPDGLRRFYSKFVNSIKTRDFKKKDITNLSIEDVKKYEKEIPGLNNFIHDIKKLRDKRNNS